MTSEAQLVLDAHALNGETPTWSEAEQKLYWIDIEEPALHRFDPASGKDEHWRMPSEIGAFALARDGRILAALRTGLMLIDLERGSSELLADPPYDPLTHRFNDGKCDPQGRFWIGTMFKPLDGRKPGKDTPPTQLFVYDGVELRPTAASAVIANGLAWSPDGGTLYFSDSHAQRIDCFDFDGGDGRIACRREFAKLSTGVPDGAAVDIEGCYWTANYGGSRLIRFLPDGRVEREVMLPVSRPTMCAFGGAELNRLFVTSARSGLSEGEQAKELHAGGLFLVEPPCPGVPVAGFGGQN